MFPFLPAVAFLLNLDCVAQAASPESGRPQACESQTPQEFDAPCILNDGSVFGGAAVIEVVSARAPRKVRYVPLSARHLQEAVIPALLAGFDPETTLTEGSLAWVNDHEFTASLSPRGRKGSTVNVKGSVVRECLDRPQKKVGSSCRFTIQFNPAVREVSSVSAVIPYRGDDLSGFRPQDVEISWDAPILKRPVLNLIEGTLKEEVVRSVSDYTIKLLSDPSAGTSGQQKPAVAPTTDPGR
jgi:hypothetical protein